MDDDLFYLFFLIIIHICLNDKGLYSILFIILKFLRVNPINKVMTDVRVE